MTTVRALLLLGVSIVTLSSCGGDSAGSEPGAVQDQAASETAYKQAHKDAWIKACNAAVADIHRRDSSRRVTQVRCARPQGQYEGNSAFDPELARAQGREEGTFDGCAYAWDEAYASSGVDVEPRC